MTLFRELPDDRRDRFVDISIKQQDSARDLYVSLSDRARAFLTAILFLGLLLVAFLLHERHYPLKGLHLSAACFLLGLFLIGLLHAANFEISRIAMVRTVDRLRLIFQNVVPIEGNDAPPVNIRLAYSVSVLAYAAFALWVAGMLFAFPTIYGQTVYDAEPSALEARPPPKPPVIDGEVIARPEIVGKAKATEWTVTDTVTTAVGVAQFLALLFTWKVMRDTSRRQLRAYVLPYSFSLSDGTTVAPPAPANTPGVWLEMRNSGQTPAYGMLSWANIEVIEPLNEDKLIVPPLANVSAATLPPNGSTTKGLWLPRSLTPQEVSDIHQGIRHIYVHGRIEYWDVFKKKRYSNFRVSYQGSYPPVGTPVMSFRNSGNEST